MKTILGLAFSVAAALVLAVFETAPAQEPVPSDATLFPKDAVILFQGDSITDGNRGRNDDPNHIHGHGYVYLIASCLGANFPERNWTFVNRGVSGDTVNTLLERWQQDTIDIHPDVLSIMIGCNDFWGHHTPEEFEEGYDRLLKWTRKALPNVRLILMEPFWSDERGNELAEKMRAVVRKMAERYDAVFVPLQDGFDKYLDQGPDHYWIWDKVHPTTAGHWIIFRQWLDAVRHAE